MAMEKLLKSFGQYYDVRTENVIAPFVAQAEFHAHDEHYVFVRAAKISESDSNEYVYFHQGEKLDLFLLNTLCHKAWTDGISKINPYFGHRNSDVVLVVLADFVDDAEKKKIKKMRYYKSYKFSFCGWSHFKLVVKELSSGKVFCNNQGTVFRKTLSNI